MKEFDIAIIGAGQAGPNLAKSLARSGKSVALIERKYMGGSCINFGCTPTKAAFASARIAHLARRASGYGIDVPEVRPNFAQVLARAENIAQNMRDALRQKFSGLDNPVLMPGHAHFLTREQTGFRLAVGDQQILARQAVLDTGTRSSLPPIDGLQEIDCIDAENWLYHRTLPQHLAIIGGGYIGLEMAQFYRRMGAEVTVVESGGQIADKEDADVAHALQRLLEAEGIAFRLHSKAKRFRKTDTGVAISLDDDDAMSELSASHVFLALGRKPNTDDLGLENIGLGTTKKGYLEVDTKLRTLVPGVWAVGDIRGGPMFTHTAWDDYRIVQSQLIGDESRTTERIVPYAVFTDPQLGRVGMTEKEARQAGRNIQVAHFDMKNNGKAREIGEMEGIIKVVADANSRRILGAAVLAVEGAELVHIYVALMNADVPYPVLENAIQIHPTLAEAVQSAVSALKRIA